MSGFAHGPTYETAWIMPCTMKLLRHSEPQSKVPHNALADAIALMEWHRSLQEEALAV